MQSSAELRGAGEINQNKTSYKTTKLSKGTIRDAGEKQ